MSREIKFRAWDKESYEFYFDKVGGYADDGDVFIGHIGYFKGVLEQFTGLLDKNCKEIYEGDILMRDSECVCAVKYKTVNGRFEAQGKLHTIHAHKFKLVKVIGNIHENPELLNL